MWIGIDDTDSIKGGCTTYLAALICEEFNCKFLPRLIRLNPNIPHKTSGNGAVALNIEGSSRKIKEFTLNLIERKAHFKEVNTNPGIVFIEDIKSTDQKLLKAFYLKAVSQYVEIKEADELSSRISAEVHRFKNGRGVIGALAALGSVLEDRTYELIAYRNESAKGLR
jgi:tRNA(Ile2)-agmatinylcytidine synthase